MKTERIHFAGGGPDPLRQIEKGFKRPDHAHADSVPGHHGYPASIHEHQIRTAAF